MIYVADTAGLPYGDEDRGRRSRRGLPALLGRLAERYSPAPGHASPATPPRTIALGMVREVLRRAGRRHRAGDQARGGDDQDRRDRPARHRGDDPAGLRRPARDANSPTARCCCAMPRPDSSQAAEANLRGEAGRSGGVSPRPPTGLRSQPGGERIDTVVLACTHFPLLRAELRDGVRAAASPSSHGAAGHRPPHRLSDQGPGIRPQAIRTLRVFTGDESRLAELRPALASYGLAGWMIL